MSAAFCPNLNFLHCLRHLVFAYEENLFIVSDSNKLNFISEGTLHK